MPVSEVFDLPLPPDTPGISITATGPATGPAFANISSFINGDNLGAPATAPADTLVPAPAPQAAPPLGGTAAGWGILLAGVAAAGMAAGALQTL